MNRENIISSQLFEARGPFSHAVKVSGFSNLIFTSTVAAIDKNWQVIGEGDIRKQTEATIVNLKKALQEAGATIKDVVKVNWYLTDISHFQTVLEVREQMFEGNKPASATIPIGPLVIPELLLEADAIAIIN
ncbi:putative translation initiation inhibitor, yjgF family [Rivularia sp. PCC 7116]|uniref:RidA family protein n=1 Tax=Rivularia sp. PCC 7116 TaxID=373994 RepID=UPI00029EEAE6|nr:RidA family protein [Rivularia sp. PCC 7116]AFY58091.1 putative translation initiation inhibitor, yjgF family [Rivularia sp. PCC 7116]